MRLAIIGNSHTACLLHAIRDGGWAQPGLDIIFFAAIGQNLDQLRRSGDRLVPKSKALADSIRTTSGGLEDLVPADFDAFLLVGLGYNVPPVDRRLSQAVQQGVNVNTVKGSLAWRIAGMVRELSAGPILVQHSPLRAGDTGPQHDEMLAKAVSYDRLIDRAETVWAELGARVVRQPVQTRYRDILSARSFSRGSRGLRGAGLAHQDTDRSHMNAAFGEIMLTEVAGMLASMPASGPGRA